MRESLKTNKANLNSISTAIIIKLKCDIILEKTYSKNSFETFKPSLQSRSYSRSREVKKNNNFCLLRVYNQNVRSDEEEDGQEEFFPECKPHFEV